MSTKLGVVLSVLCLVLVGCNPLTMPSLTPAPLSFSVQYNEREVQPFQADWLILSEYQSRQNVTLDVRTRDDADYEIAIIQALEAEEQPDVILKVWPDQVESYASNGALLPFSEYEELMPNFTAYIQAHDLQAEVDKLRLSDGKYYVLPGYQRAIQVQQWVYRQDAFEENGLSAPKTYDELFDALVILKERYPDSTPLTTLWGGAHLFAMMGAGYGIPAGWAGTRDFDAETNRWQFAPATDNFRELYRFLHRCYAAGVLDPESLTQSDEEFIAKMTDGRALVTVTWITSGFGNWDQTLRDNGIPNGKWAPLRVPESTIGIRAVPAVDPFRKGLIVPSSVVNDATFTELLKFLDWAIYSEEGMTLTTWGVEGVTYEQTPTGKVFLPRQETPIDADAMSDLTVQYGLDTMFNLNENVEFEDYKKPAEIVAFLNESLRAQETAQIDPRLELDASAIEAVRILSERINPFVTESSMGFITGAVDIESGWADYLDSLEQRGYRTLEEIWNAAWIEQTGK